MGRVDPWLVLQQVQDCLLVCEIAPGTGMLMGGVRRLCGPTSRIYSRQPVLYSLPPWHCWEKLSSHRKFPQQQFPALGRRAEYTLTEFPGKIHEEEGKIKKGWDTKIEEVDAQRKLWTQVMWGMRSRYDLELPFNQSSLLVSGLSNIQQFLNTCFNNIPLLTNIKVS